MARTSAGGVTESQIQNSTHTFAADAEASDTYAITLDPALTAYATGQHFIFTANTANTGAATLNVNGLGAKNILKRTGTTLANNDIASGSVVEVVYDGTQFQMISMLANAPAGSGDMVLADVQTVTGAKTFNSGKLIAAGATSGTIVLNATAIAGTNTLTFPAATDTLVGKATTDTLSNKTIAAGTFTTSMTGSYLTASEILITDGSKNIVSAPVATYPSLTELTYLKGVTSAIQTQINAKTSNTGTVTSVAASVPTGLTISGSPVTTSGTLAIALDTGYEIFTTAAIAAKAPLASPTFTGTVTTPATNVTGDVDMQDSDIILGNSTSETSSIKLNDSALADEKWSGTTIAATAGATLAVGDVCYLASTGKWLLNDGILDGTDTGFDKKLGICVLASTDTNPTEILLDGVIASAAFPAFTVGSPVYLDDTAGNLVVAQPTTTNFAIRVVGEAVSATVLHFSPSRDYIVHV